MSFGKPDCGGHSYCSVLPVSLIHAVHSEFCTIDHCLTYKRCFLFPGTSVHNIMSDISGIISRGTASQSAKCFHLMMAVDTYSVYLIGLFSKLGIISHVYQFFCHFFKNQISVNFHKFTCPTLLLVWTIKFKASKCSETTSHNKFQALFIFPLAESTVRSDGPFFSEICSRFIVLTGMSSSRETGTDLPFPGSLVSVEPDSTFGLEKRSRSNWKQSSQASWLLSVTAEVIRIQMETTW